MKKLFVIVLAAVAALSCGACTGFPISGRYETHRPFRDEYDAVIFDERGNEICFWNDGLSRFHDVYGYKIQTEKHADLYEQIEYDLCFYYYERQVDFATEYVFKFVYDESKIKIEENPDIENHFIIKLIKPCDNEEIRVNIIDRQDLGYYGDEIVPSRQCNGVPLLIGTKFFVSSI
ncbi:MAG: hypothetical protein J1F33_06340 [Clostridiales bacterium]|nr:hypothetical protein [Clostridiales bacterium]